MYQRLTKTTIQVMKKLLSLFIMAFLFIGFTANASLPDTKEKQNIEITDLATRQKPIKLINRPPANGLRQYIDKAFYKQLKNTNHIKHFIYN